MGKIAGFDPLGYSKFAKATCGETFWRELRDADNPLDYQGKDAVFLLAKWDITRGVYRFDPTLREAIGDMDILKSSGALINSLPEQCLFVELNETRAMNGETQDGTPVLNDIFVYGAYVYVYPQDHFVSLVRMFVMVRQPLDGATVALPLRFLTHADKDLSWALYDGLKGTGARSRLYPDFIPELFGYAAYLCSAEPDIYSPQEPRNKPNRHVKNNGPVRHWQVGYRFGAAFRKQLAEAEKRAAGYAGDERNRPRVHVRRAHWHSFWTGPMTGERKLVTKWLPPIIVNAEGGELPVTVWRQREQ